MIRDDEEPNGDQHRRTIEEGLELLTRQAAAVLVLHGTATRVADLRAIMFPQRSYLAARGISATGHFRRAWNRIVK